MFVEKKKIKGKSYLYLRKSTREGKKTSTKTIAYLGKATMKKAELQRKIKKFKIVEESVPTADITSPFLTEAQQKKLQQIKTEFTQKLKQLEQKLLDDMFRDFKTYYIYNTNAIEGNTLTLEETNLLLNENKTPEGKDLREVYDHLNEKNTFDYILAAKPEISTKSIVDIHARLMKNIDARTGFRRHNVRVVGAEFTPTAAEYVLTDMNLLLKWCQQYEKMMNPLILAAIFHEKFERIHPFYDGNGRTGRMLLNLILLRKEYPPLIIKNKDRKEYYTVLSQGHKAGFLKNDQLYYQPIVSFCYTKLLETFEQIFTKWG